MRCYTQGPTSMIENGDSGMHTVSTILFHLLLLAYSVCTHAQQYPTKPVRIVASVLPGDTCDTLARLAGYKLSEKFGQQFVIDNRVGASGAIGHTIVAQAAPDGYTLGCGNGGSMAILPHVTKGVPYNVHKDFTAIALMATNFMALAVGGNSSFKTVNDLVQHAKQNPGKVSFGSNGEGAFLHFATELFRSTAGFTYLHVPFKGLPQLAGEERVHGVPPLPGQPSWSRVMVTLRLCGPQAEPFLERTSPAVARPATHLVESLRRLACRR